MPSNFSWCTYAALEQNSSISIRSIFLLSELEKGGTEIARVFKTLFKGVQKYATIYYLFTYLLLQSFC